jgi:hypothetical protein
MSASAHLSSPVYGGGVERSETEGGNSGSPPLAACGGTPPVNGGRKVEAQP